MAAPVPWNQMAFAYGSANQSVTTTAETVVATVSGINSRWLGSPINLNGFCVVTFSASTTALVLRVRIGSVTGSVVGAASTTSVAQGTLATAAAGIEVQDTSAVEYASQAYVLTVVCTGAASTSTVVTAALAAVY